MLRTFDLIMILAMLAAAAITYTIKYDAEKQIAVIAKLQRQIDSERDTIKLLHADWALMSQPGRLENLVGIYNKQLNLQTITGEQIIGSLDEIPERPADEIQKIISGSDELVASGVLAKDAARTSGIGTDRIRTGSIKKNGTRH
ncbi:MAG: hypothetical protein J0H18_03790 [Rhizobiales bacterium]|nr:hypothetical protein [Hyphomicrobiales bacterium]OJY06133.1 MAG: hypothetical protein BGP07_00565 [Rhizobiales bacterium 63-22]